MARIVITGAAGLIGQNLIARLAPRRDLEIVAIDKHPANTALLRKMQPGIQVIEADLAEAGSWADAFHGADALVLGQAQIGGLQREPFVANNVTATDRVLEAATRAGVKYIVHISSSVVNSQAQDLYSETKRSQEALIDNCTIRHVVLRPTLMFGWFDRKHLGWLRRFMERTPVFPVPGNGRYLRQPLYAGDFVAIIMSCLEHHNVGSYDISGLERIEYGAMIRLIHDIVKARARIVNIPYGMFYALLWVYAKFDRDPPFTTHQLAALVLPETFPVIDWPGIFGVTATPLRKAFEETYLDPRYASIALEF